MTLTLGLIFSEQNFVGTHEVLGWARSVENLDSPEQDLGSVVVTQGPDFTISATPATATLPNQSGTTSVNLTVTISSVNGFSGDVQISYSHDGACSFTVPGFYSTVWVPSGQSVTVSQGVTIQNIQGQTNCPNGSSETFTFLGAATASGTWRSAPTITITAGPSPDFTLTVGSPYPVTLTSTGSTSYPITVTPLNGFNGTVSLSVPGLPTCTVVPVNCVSASFSPSQVPQAGNLAYGTNTGGSAGVTFPAVVTPPTGYQGSPTQWVQVVGSSTASYSDGTPPNQVCTSSGLDTRYPYTQRATFTDSPVVASISWATDFTVADSYTAYLMWSPGTPSAIFVPIAQVPWSWSAEATQSAQGSWSLKCRESAQDS